MGGVNSKGEEHAFRVLSYFARDWPVIADVRKTLEAYPSLATRRDELTLTTLLHEFAGHNEKRWVDVPDILRLLIIGGADVNARNENGSTPLMVLIDALPRIDDQYLTEESQDEWRTITHAMGKATALLNRGADPNLPTLDRRYPITELAKRGYPWIIRDLFDHGADLTVKSRGQTALEWAEEYENHKAAEWIRACLEWERG